MTIEINITTDDYFEIKNLVSDAYLPLKKLTDKKNFISILENFSLTTGEIFPFPIFLDVDNLIAKKLKIGNIYKLKLKNIIIGTIKISDIYKIDKLYSSQKIFGTTDSKHPGVKKFIYKKDFFLGGEIKLFPEKKIDRKLPYLYPKLTKDIFKKNKWKTVVGFQTRNIPHRAHEQLLRTALEYCDGLFINPLVGYKKTGDFTNEAVFKSYEFLIENYFTKNRAYLGPLNASMWYAGPREALFHAIIRKNYGCTHFIVGRDHAGVGNFYGKYEAQKIFKNLNSSLGIQILNLGGPFHCKYCDGIVTENSCPHFNNPNFNVKHISGTDVRNKLLNNKYLSRKIIRPEIVKILKKIDKLFI
ncbi:sulfate adenylyltransferase [SAR116 cluster bacterium]|nr:sulfate adenylyltransferase [SAR116 cluster bacterium]